MMTYYVTSKPIALGGRGRTVRADNIDNLRRNLAARMKKGETRNVYTDKNGSFIGVLGNLGSESRAWPHFMWISNGIDYAVDLKDGTIRRF